MFLKEQSGKRMFLFAFMTLALTYAAWGLVAFNPGGWFAVQSPQRMVLYALGGLSPAIVTFALVKKWGMTEEERAYFKPLFRTAYGWKAAVCVALLFCAAFFCMVSFFSERIEPWYMLVAAFPVGIVAGGLEEIGWRGFFQPALEKKMPFWLATLVTGLVWGAWHIPLWFIPGMGPEGVHFISYLLFTVLMSYILGALQRLTGSVAACIAFHAWINVVFSVFSVIPILEGENFLLFMGLLAGFAAAATAAVYMHKQKSRETPSQP